MGQPERTKLTEAILDALTSERERTGVGFAKLLRRSESLPEGLSSRLIFTWFYHVKSARSDHLQFVMDAYAALPTLHDAEGIEPGRDKRLAAQRRFERRVEVGRKLSSYVPITSAERAALRDELTRSGIRYTTLMAIIPAEFSDISSRMIKGWISGEIAKARPEYLKCVLDILNDLPDPASKLAGKTKQAPPPKNPIKTKKKARVIEPKPIKKTRKLTLSGPDIVMPKASEIENRKIRPDLNEDKWIVQKPWKPIEAPSSQCRQYLNLYQMIDKETYERLHAELRRTCVSPFQLLKLFDSAPHSLPARRISEWMRLVTRSGEKKLITWTLKAYALLPDAPQD